MGWLFHALGSSDASWSGHHCTIWNVDIIDHYSLDALNLPPLSCRVQKAKPTRSRACCFGSSFTCAGGGHPCPFLALHVNECRRRHLAFAGAIFWETSLVRIDGLLGTKHVFAASHCTLDQMCGEVIRIYKHQVASPHGENESGNSAHGKSPDPASVLCKAPAWLVSMA